MNIEDINIKELITNNIATFDKIVSGIAHYKILIPTTDKFINIQIDMKNLSDVGEGEFKSQDKAIYFMRWIRRSIEQKTAYITN